MGKTFEAFKRALPKLSEFKVCEVDENAITVNLCAGVSWFSFGENTSVTLVQTQAGGTVVSILSTPKVGVLPGGVAGLFICKNNIKKIMQALLAELDDDQR